MKILKWVAVTLVIYITFVVVFEAGYLGYTQPSFEEAGIPMLRLTTVDDGGESQHHMLAKFVSDQQLYVSAHHWTRGWYHRARANPNVQVEMGETLGNYVAVPVSGDEFEQVAADHPLPFVARLLMGFPPPRDILRLDPVN